LAIGASNVAIQRRPSRGTGRRNHDSIESSSKKIVDIISVIDGIAFQTNILALNAAVEAAAPANRGEVLRSWRSEVAAKPAQRTVAPQKRSTADRRIRRESRRRYGAGGIRAVRR